MGNDRAKKKHERELKRRRHRKEMRIDASLRTDPEKKTKITSWKSVIEEIIADTAQLLGAYNDLKRIYKARMTFAENKRAEDPSVFSDARFEEYQNFGKEIENLKDTVHTLVSLTASLEDREDTRERMDFFFEHMDEFHEGREKFMETMGRMQDLDEHFIEDMKKLSTKVAPVEASDEMFDEEAKSETELTETETSADSATEEVVAEVEQAENSVDEFEVSVEAEPSVKETPTES